MRNKIPLILLLILSICPSVYATPDPYADYLNRLNLTVYAEDIAANGFNPLDEHIFNERFQSFGFVDVIPALDEKYGRIILFFADESGRIVYKTDRIISNCWNRGEMNQPNTGLAAITFLDMNEDGFKDIVVIAECADGEKTYKVGDVLFQGDSGFYSDWRLTDKLNRFSMNRNIDMVIASVCDGRSTEFLYTASTLDELLAGGFNIIEEQSFDVDFEKFARVSVISGTYDVAEQSVLMIYLINPNGRIIWNFQFMDSDYNFDTMMGIAFRDIDGDGLLDVVVLVGYSVSTIDGNVLTKPDYFIFYQRTGYFQEDESFKRTYTCTEHDVLDTITQKARIFWGWEAKS